MELIQVGERTYYIKNPTNIGIYKINDTDVYLIDTRNDKDAGKKILKITDAQGWTVKGIITTHSNADHIGGNKVIQDRTKCPVYALGMNPNQYVLIGSTVRSYLCDDKKISFAFHDNKMYWKASDCRKLLL